VTRPGPELTERDKVIMRSLADYRLLTTEQVQRLHFPSNQTALRRLRRLEAAKLVHRHRTHVLSTYAVTLTAKGAELLLQAGATSSDGPGMSRRPVRLPGEFFLRHMVAVNDLRIALELAVRRHSGVDLLGVLTDAVRTSVGPTTQPQAVISESVSFGTGDNDRLVHVPDLAFALRRGDRQALFLAEVDRGTEVVGDPKRGVGLFVRFYLQALLTEAFQSLGARLGGPAGFQGFRILVVTTTNARVEAIRARWGTMPVEPELAKRLIWLSSSEALRSGALLEHEWCSLDPRDSRKYVIVPPQAGGES